jgi:hypothetical protein
MEHPIPPKPVHFSRTAGLLRVLAAVLSVAAGLGGLLMVFPEGQAWLKYVARLLIPKPPLPPSEEVKTGWYGWIEVNSTQCRAWVLPPPPAKPQRRDDVSFHPELGEVSFAGNLDVVPSDFQLRAEAGQQVEEKVKERFRELTDLEHLPPENIFIVANGLLSPDVLDGEVHADQDQARQVLAKAVAAATGKHLRPVLARDEVKAKIEALMPEEKRDAFLLDVGPDLVRVGWVQGSSIHCRCYPLLQDPSWNIRGQAELQRMQGLGPLRSRKHVYRCAEGQRASAPLPKFLDKLLVGKTIQESAGDAAWIRAYIDAHRNEVGQ